MAKVHCKYDELLDPSKLKDHPENPNKHSKDQIERLVELYKYHGIRHPIILNKKTKQIMAGHGRKLAAIKAGIKQFPVVYQEFKTKEQELAFLVADNAIAEWAELDLKGLDLKFSPKFNVDMLGIKDFTFDIPKKDFKPNMDDKSVDEEMEKGVTKMVHECPSCGHRFN